MSEERDILIEGTVLNDQYRIDAVLGKGGMGEVYAATQIPLNRKVAVKILQPRLTGNAILLERFRREARMAGSIKHDNICEVTDIGATDDGIPFLVMPLLEGESLGKRMARERLSAGRITDIALQILAALESAHQAGVVHRDLKPDNIFVTQMGDRRGFVKLIDFGVSKLLDDQDRSDLTRTSEVIGTAYYMSPEQTHDAKAVDHRTDIYALGVIMYEALTGRRPFEGAGYVDVVCKIRQFDLIPPRDLVETIDVELEEIVLKAMAPASDRRFNTASEMRDALETFAGRAGMDGGKLSPAPYDTEVQTKAERGDAFRPDDLQAAVSQSASVEKRGRRRRLWLAIAAVLAIAGAIWSMMHGSVKDVERIEADHTMREPTVSETARPAAVVEPVEETPRTDGSRGGSGLERPRRDAEAVSSSVTEKRRTGDVASPSPLTPASIAAKKIKKKRSHPSPSTGEQKRSSGLSSDEKETPPDGIVDETVTGRKGTTFFKEY